MIFVGGGALLWRAVRHAQGLGHPVDLVCARPGPLPHDPGIEPGRVRQTDDVNLLADELRAAATDGVVWSIDNPFIFRAPVLELGLRIVNVHGGPLPGYRGLPVAGVAYALLNGESRYGATLHEVDSGVDTGPVIAERDFEIDPEDTFEDVMMEVVEICHQLFIENLEDVLAGRAASRPQPAGPGGYYGVRSMREMTDHRGHRNFERATDLGMFEDFYPKAAELWR